MTTLGLASNAPSKNPNRVVDRNANALVSWNWYCISRSSTTTTVSQSSRRSVPMSVISGRRLNIDEAIATLPNIVAAEWHEADERVTEKRLRARLGNNPPGSYNEWLAEDTAMRRRLGYQRPRGERNRAPKSSE